MKILSLAALLLAAAAASPVAAEPVSRTVATADLDLTTEAGRRALDRRVARTIVDLCGDASAADLAGLNAVRACRAEAHVAAAAQRDTLLAARRSGSEIVLAAR